jgi:hypothetical protein
MAANPAYRCKGSDALLMKIRANPKRMTTIGSKTRAPYWSSKRPTKNIKAAAVKDPAVYSPETVVLDHPRSSIMGFTKSETA